VDLFRTAICLISAAIALSLPSSAAAQSPAGCQFNQGSSSPAGSPVVTHWNGSAPQFGATVKPILTPSYPYQFGSPALFPLPYTNDLPADIYSPSDLAAGSENEVPSTSVDALVANYCMQSGGWPFRFYNAADPNLITYLLNETPVPGWSRTGTGRVRIIHGLMLYESFVTVMLPPNFDQRVLNGTAPPYTRHPIVAQGFYDVNDNVFSGFGNAHTIASIVAESGLGSRAGVIGLVWNNGSSTSSLMGTATDRSRFNSIINWLYSGANGDRTKLYMLGRSRGATTALLMASNPDPHDYIVRFVSVIAPGTRFGEHSELIGATIPGQLNTPGTATGLIDAWRPGWTYPAWGRPQLVGKDGRAATRHVLFGSAFENPATLDQSASLVSPSFVAALAAAQTKVLMVVGSHDEFIPFGQQVEYVSQLHAAGISTEAHLVLRGGHLYDDIFAVYSSRFRNAVIGELDGVAASVTPGTWYWRLEQNGAATWLGSIATPFTLQVPYRLYAGMPLHVLATGPAGLQYEIQTNVGNILRGLSPGRQFDAFGVDTSALGNVTVSFSKVRYRLNSLAPWVELDLNKVTGCGPQTAPLSIGVLPGPAPTLRGIDLYRQVRVPPILSCGEVGWGLAQYAP
jgi:acetyl esterase/lipase